MPAKKKIAPVTLEVQNLKLGVASPQIGGSNG